MADDYKPQQGDEAELFVLYNDELRRRVQRAVNTSPETVEDACSVAWSQSSATSPITTVIGEPGCSRRRSAKRGLWIAHAGR
jgi:hypothetical protein